MGSYKKIEREKEKSLKRLEHGPTQKSAPLKILLTHLFSVVKILTKQVREAVPWSRQFWTQLPHGISSLVSVFRKLQSRPLDSMTRPMDRNSVQHPWSA